MSVYYCKECEEHFILSGKPDAKILRKLAKCVSIGHEIKEDAYGIFSMRKV